MKYSDIGELIEILETQKLELEKSIIALKRKPNSFEEKVIFKYIETKSTVKTAKFVKEMGIKSPKGTVYAPGDVSNLIYDSENDVDNDLLKIAKGVFKKNTKAINRVYG